MFIVSSVKHVAWLQIGFHLEISWKLGAMSKQRTRQLAVVYRHQNKFVSSFHPRTRMTFKQGYWYHRMTKAVKDLMRLLYHYQPSTGFLSLPIRFYLSWFLRFHEYIYGVLCYGYEDAPQVQVVIDKRLFTFPDSLRWGLVKERESFAIGISERDRCW